MVASRWCRLPRVGDKEQPPSSWGQCWGPLEGVGTPCTPHQQGDSTQKPPHIQMFWRGTGEEITTPEGWAQRNALARGGKLRGRSPVHSQMPLIVFICINKIQKRVSAIAPPKVRGKITCPRVTPGTCGKVQPAGRFVKGERRPDLPQILSTCTLHLETAEGKYFLTYK